jgi:hypothetical protein
MTVSDWVSVIEAAGVIGSILFLYFEYRRQNKLARSQFFFEKEKDFKSSPKMQRIVHCIEETPEELHDILVEDKYEYIGLFEHIAFALNSKVISKAAAFNFFGHYAIQCADCDEFWSDLDRDSIYWSVFFRFVNEMRAFQKKVLKKGQIPLDL